MSATLDISEARKRLNHLDRELRGKEKPFITVTRHGKDAFAVVDLDFLQTVIETIEIMSDPESAKYFYESLNDIRDERMRDHEDIKKELI